MAAPGWTASLNVPPRVPSAARTQQVDLETPAVLLKHRNRVRLPRRYASRVVSSQAISPEAYNDFGDVTAFRWRTDRDSSAPGNEPGADRRGQGAGGGDWEGAPFDLELPNVPDDPFEHPALFYSGLDEFVAGSVRFVEEALEVGEPVAVAVPKPNLDAVTDALGDKADEVVLINMSEAGANPWRIIPGVKGAFAETHPDRRVRMIGEPIWPGRTDYEYPACVQHEALINYAFVGRQATILCPYDVDRLDDQMVADARATHPTILDREGLRESDEFAPDRIIAEYNRPLERLPRTAIERYVEPATLDNARWFVTSYGRKVGLPATRLIDLEIAVTELLLNSIDHGGGAGTLRVWADEEELVCEVSDSGQITDPLAGRRPVGSDREHGRGLLLVNRVVDFLRMHTSQAGTTMRFHLRLHGGAAHQAG